MNMMSTTSMTGVGTGMFWLHLHWIFGGFAIVGFILLTVWAYKNLSGDKLKSATMWILAIGIIGTLVTAPFAASGFQWMMSTSRGGNGTGHMMDGSHMQQMMQMMMGHDEGTAGTSHEEHQEMQQMMQNMMNQ